MFRIVASLVVILIVGLSWLLFGNRDSQRSSQADSTSQQQSQPSADDEALRKSLGQ